MRMRSRSRGPGLIGALLVGLSTAKALAAAHRKPLIPVDHLPGTCANFPSGPSRSTRPLCLIASGGHTLLAGVRERSGFETLGETVDDAAGEAFDKGARLLPGFSRRPRDPECRRGRRPGGVRVPRGDERARPRFPASAAKTALVYRVRDLGPEETRRRADLAASYQRAIVINSRRSSNGRPVPGSGRPSPWAAASQERRAAGVDRGALR